MSGRPLPTLGSTQPWSGGQVTDWATCLLAPNPSPWTLDGTNTWILADGDEVIVIDPGPDDPSHLAALTQALGDRKHVVTLLTHGHSDHSAAASTFFSMTGVPVRALDPHHQYGNAGLTDGDVIAFGDRELRVIHTPGHSPDSLCFAVSDVLVTGDTVLGRGTTAIIWPEGRLDEYFASLRRIAAGLAETNLLLPGHGPALHEPDRVIAEYLEHRELRLAEVRIALDSGAQTLSALLDAVYGDVPDSVRPAAELSLRAQLEYLRDREGAAIPE